MKYRINQTTQKLQEEDKNYLLSTLHSRGVPVVWKYVEPDKSMLLNPADLEHIDDGVKLLAHHLVNDSNIFLVVDCDNDGVTSAAMMYNYIKRIYPEAKIKWMMHDGKQHGIELERVPEDTNLVIVPDAGSNQLDEHIALKMQGMDVLVIDHHIAPLDMFESSPAVIINNQMSERYVDKDLSGAGVVYKFLQEYDHVMDQNYADDYLDLAAVGIIGDMMDLRSYEVRYIVKEGLSHVKNPGLKHFIAKQAFSISDVNNITPTVISFYITPLINAIIRVGTMDEKETLFRAFIDGDSTEQSTKRGAKPGDVEIVGEKAARLATNAKSRQQKMREKSLGIIDMKIEQENLDENKILLVALNEEESEMIDPNLTGLVAMQVLTKYKKPTILVRKTTDGTFKGSLRADSNSELANFKDFLTDSTYFEFAEGHEAAAGVSIKEKNIEPFIAYSNDKLKDVNVGDNVYTVDFEFTPDNFDQLKIAVEQLEEGKAIWGRGVEQPKIVITDFECDESDIMVMGKNQDSVKITKDGIAFVKFKDENFIEKLQSNLDKKFEFIGTTQENTFAGRTTPQFIIDDYNIVG